MLIRRTAVFSTLLTLLLAGQLTKLAAAERSITLIGFSVGPGQWVAHYSEPIEEAELKPFIGRYLLGGNWPKGVTDPNDPKLLLNHENLSCTRVVDVKVQQGGHLVHLTTDPVNTPEEHFLKIGDITLGVVYRGFEFRLGPPEAEGPKFTLGYPVDRKGLDKLAAMDPELKKLETAWKDAGQTLTLRSWLHFPPRPVSMTVKAGREFVIEFDGRTIPSENAEDRHGALLEWKPEGVDVEWSITFPATSKPISSAVVLDFTVPSPPGFRSFTKNVDVRAFLVPNSPEPLQNTTTAITEPPYALTGGDPEKGRAVFESTTARCVTCHMVEGKGGKIGPDLSGLRGAKPELVFHHINNPSESLHPGYPNFSVALKNGQVAMGVVRSIDSETLEIVDTDARSLKVSPHEITEIRPSSSSVMPAGLAGTLGEAAMRDLIAFLTRPAAGK